MTSKSKRILYLVSRENILEPGVLKSQVLDLAGEIVESSANTEITVLNFPSVNRFFKYFKNYSAVKKYSQDLGVRLVMVPILPIGRSIMPLWAIPFFLAQTVPFVLFYVIKYRINIIHVRAYLSALVAWFTRKTGLKIGLIFDMRGAYLLEGITYGRWDEKDASYKFWARIEEILFSSSDCVVAQSIGLVDYIKKVASPSNIVLIPPCVNERMFLMSPKEREKEKGKLGIKDRFVVTYSGSLGSFHEPEFLARYYSEIRKYVPSPYFLIVTHSDSRELVNSLLVQHVPEEEFRVISSPKDLGKVLPLGDVGLHIMDDLPITPTVVSVKFGEYLASGLPVIVTKNMLSITNLVDEHHCGVVLDGFDRKDTLVKMQKLVKEQQLFKKNSLKLARDYFSVKVCAKRYLKVYGEIVKKRAR